MAHFAQVDENNFVLNVIVIDNEHEQNAQEYIKNELKLDGRWIQTSYNCYGGLHYDPSTGQPDGKPALRKNAASIGFSYDEQRDAFIPPKPYNSWVLNDDTCLWEPPVAPPEDGNAYHWNEDTQVWILDN